jgi:MFS family permease
LSEKEPEVFGYRWIVLIIFMFANITMQMLWITYASITKVEAPAYYGVGEDLILLFSLVFMVAYIPMTLIASWAIDNFSFKWGAGIGAILAGVFGFLRFIAGPNYILALSFQIGIAIGQPFLLNSITKLSGNWFPESERTTATGLSLISQFIGILLGMFISPFLVLPNSDLTLLLLTYGILSLISAVLFVIFVKDEPPIPPSKRATIEKVFNFKGIKDLFTNKNFLILVVLFLIGLGTFNWITSYVDLVFQPRGYTEEEAGIIGAIMLLGGIIGCIVMSTISDKYKKRKVLIIISVLITTVSLAILSFASLEILVYLFGFLLGFGILSAGPVALEYAVEVTSPVPEASSNGILMMVGQVGGIIFIIGLVDLTFNEDYFPAVLILTILAVVLLIASFFLKEQEE